MVNRCEVCCSLLLREPLVAHRSLAPIPSRVLIVSPLLSLIDRHKSPESECFTRVLQRFLDMLAGSCVSSIKAQLTNLHQHLRLSIRQALVGQLLPSPARTSPRIDPLSSLYHYP